MSLCVYIVILDLIRLWPTWIMSMWYKLDQLRASYLCMHEWTFKIKHLTTTRNYSLTSKPVTFVSCVSTLQRLIFSRLEQQSRLLVADDLWYRFYYLFSGSDAMQCMWVGRLSGGPSLALIHVIRPYMEWHLAWPLGPRLGAKSWSAASLECQTFEVRLVKKTKAVRSLVK